MGVDDGVRLEGFDDLIKKLRELPSALRVRVLLNALRAGGRLVRDAARARAPVLQQSVPYRTAGLVRKSIVVRTSKTARQAGDVGVFVNVRPAKGARFKTSTSRVFGLKVRTRVQTRASQRGARSPVDPFYWRFVAFGTRKMRAHNFLQAGANKLPAALPIIQGALDRWIAKSNAAGKNAP